MLGEEGVIRKVAWSELFPWLVLFRCFRLAIRFRALALAAVAILVTLSGWAALGSLFSSDPAIARQIGPFRACPWLALSAMIPEKPLGTALVRGEMGGLFDAETPSIFVRTGDPLIGSWEHLSRPFREVIDQRVTVFQTAYLLFCGLWALVVWAFFGMAITRSAAVELAAGQRLAWSAMFRYSASKWLSCIGAPLLPILAVAVAVLLSALVGLLLRVGPGVVLAALVWPLVLLGWALMAVLLLGLAFGWPLMWAVIGAEGTDSFDALSRTYNYLFARPLHALFYGLVAVGLGLLGWLLVSNFASAVIYLSYWGASWGAGARAVEAVQRGDLGLAGLGASLINVWGECVKLLAIGFLYSYLWTTAAGVYFLLRRDVDAREMDEVFLEGAESSMVRDLPPLKTGDAGIPEVADAPEDEKPADSL